MKARLIQIIEATTTPHKRFKELEEWTGIPADSWRKVVSGKQRATSEMIEALGRQFPQFCEWLLTGDLRAPRQADPTAPKVIPQNGEIDLSVLDLPFEESEPDHETVQLTKQQVDDFVAAFFSQFGRKKRKK